MQPANLDIINRKPNPVYFGDSFYRTALVTAIALTTISALVAATQYTLGSNPFIGMTAVATTGFVVIVVLIMRGSFHSEQKEDGSFTDAVIVDKLPKKVATFWSVKKFVRDIIEESIGLLPFPELVEKKNLV